MRALRSLWHRLLPIAVAVLALAADQASKLAVTDRLGPAEAPRSVAVIKNVVYFTYSTNTGVAFGLLRGRGVVFALVALAIIVLLVFYFRFLPNNRIGVKIAFGLILGGALGNNLIDRVIYGKVTDFIDLHLWTDHSVWPIFNLADAWVFLGVSGLVLLLLFGADRREKASAGSSEQAG